jgi:hypothetical protein
MNLVVTPTFSLLDEVMFGAIARIGYHSNKSCPLTSFVSASTCKVTAYDKHNLMMPHFV